MASQKSSINVYMVSLTCLAAFLLDMFLVEDGIGDGVAFATGGRKSSKITRRQAMVFDYLAKELSGQAAKVVSGGGSHGGVNLVRRSCIVGSHAGSVGRCSSMFKGVDHAREAEIDCCVRTKVLPCAVCGGMSLVCEVESGRR